MTEQNMKKLYDWFIESGQLEKAKRISDIPRYAEFDPKVKAQRDKEKDTLDTKDTKSKKVK